MGNWGGRGEAGGGKGVEMGKAMQNEERLYYKKVLIQKQILDALIDK